MTEPSDLPDSLPSSANPPVDPLAETRMAPPEPTPLAPKSAAILQNPAPTSVAPQDDSLSETFNIPADRGTLPLRTPGKQPEPPTRPAPPPTDPLAETRVAPSELQDPAAGAFGATRLASPSQSDNPTETIAHASRPPEGLDQEHINTRMLERPSEMDPAANDRGIPITLVVDSTKQPPVAPGPHDTPLVPTPGFSSMRSIPGMPQHVGDYEILGVLGRGGMGVVYKARQKRLNRIVALKMILGGLHAGDEDLRRFRQEAEASARLQHPNIVQIHEVGEMDGKPYFSLEYVDGGCLANKMANEPQPAFSAAQLIEILARAMHYAHQRGIVHRDLKPANILLATAPPDGSATAPVTSFGIPKVTDFGLAKRMDVDLGQTQTGAIMGTPSYMAPEQAGGRIREIGPATDIYALGAILYDLLTGRPPFKANTLADTLQQVQMAEPVSPGRLQPQVPRDLATICLKCLNKEPKKRYESSMALAEDLGRFLAGEPIRARPTSLLERGFKWSKRHPSLAALIAVCILSFVGLGIGGWYYAASLYWANQEIKKANELAQAERVRAEDNFEQALTAIDGVLTDMGVSIEEVPLLEKPRLKILTKAVLLFKHIVTEDQKTPQALFKSARAKERLGEAELLLDHLSAAEAAYKEAEVGFKELIASAPKKAEYRGEMARTSHDMGLLYRKLGLFGEASCAFWEAMDLREDLVRESPDELSYLKDYAQSIYWLGATLARMRGGQEEAEEMYQLAIHKQDELLAAVKDNQLDAGDMRRDFTRDKARMLNNLGILYGLTGRRNQAIAIFESAEAIQKALAANNSDIPTIRRELARTLNNKAFQQWKTEGKRTSAETTFGEAIELLESLIRDFPSVPAYRDELATFCRTQGVLLQEVQRPEEAAAAFGKSLAIHQGLVRDFLQLPDYQSKLSDDYLAIGRLQLMEERFAPLCEQMFAKALELQEDLVKRFPDNGEYHKNLSNTYKNLGTRIDQLYSINQPFSLKSPMFSGMIETATLLSVASMAQPICQNACLPSAASMTLAGSVVVNSMLNSQCLRRAPRAALEAREPALRAVQEIRKALEIEPRREDYKSALQGALKDLANTELRLRDHSSVAKIALERAALEPNDPSTRMETAEYLATALVQVEADPLLAQEVAQELEKRYLNAALENLKEAGRLDAGYTMTKLFDPTAPTWKLVLQRPEFKVVVDKLKEALRPNGT
jgi:eukaryotic-like serine/threonine-protein kinase